MRRLYRRSRSIYVHIAHRQQQIVAAYVWARQKSGQQYLRLDVIYPEYVRWCHRVAGNVDLAVGEPHFAIMLRRWGWRHSRQKSTAWWHAPAGEDMLVEDLLAYLAEETDELLWDPRSAFDRFSGSKKR